MLGVFLTVRQEIVLMSMSSKITRICKNKDLCHALSKKYFMEFHHIFHLSMHCVPLGCFQVKIAGEISRPPLYLPMRLIRSFLSPLFSAVPYNPFLVTFRMTDQ